MRFSAEKNKWLIPALLVGLTLLAYMRSFKAGFVSWDDAEVLAENPDVHGFNLEAFFTKFYVGNYAPVTMIVFAVEWLLFKGAPFWHHLSSILVHAINGILVYKLSQLILKNNSASLFTALIFCLHPLQAETVAWIAAKNNIISCFFFLLSIIYYVKFKGTSLKKNYTLSLFLFLLAALSKPSALVLPLCLLVIDYIHQPKKINFINKLPFLLISIAIGVVSIYARKEADFLSEKHSFPFHERIGYAGYALFSYISKFLVPIKQSVIYPYPSAKNAAIITGCFILITLGILTFLLVKKGKGDLAGYFLFFVLNLILVLQFIPFGEVLTADRYMYVPIIGLCWFCFSLLKLNKQMVRLGLTVLVCSFFFKTYMRAGVWKNSIELYSDILKTYPNSPEALSSIGAEYFLKGDYEKARLSLDRAIALSPKNFKAHYHRALLYAQNKIFEKALQDFSQAISLNNDYTRAYTGRAQVYYELRDYTKATSDAELVLSREPKNFKAAFVLGNCYNDLNMLDKAIFYYNTAISTHPSEPLFYFKRAITYGKGQRFQESIADLSAAVKLNPNFAEAYYWMGVSKINLKQDPCSDLKKAYELGFSEAQKPLLNYCR